MKGAVTTFGSGKIDSLMLNATTETTFPPEIKREIFSVRFLREES